MHGGIGLKKPLGNLLKGLPLLEEFTVGTLERVDVIAFHLSPESCQVESSKYGTVTLG
jgi:hypothetical protein